MANMKVGDRTIKVTKAPKGAPRSKRPGANNGPARQRYWSNNKLEKNKVRNIMLDTGLSRAEAAQLWNRARQGRKK
jgi:hypothetical protein